MQKKRVKLKEENITKVWINKDGVVAVNQKEIPLAELEPTIKRIVKENPDMVISLKTDRKSKYKFMVQVLDRLQAAGAEKISLSTN